MSSFFSYSLACRFWPRPLFHGQESMAVSSTGTQFAGRGDRLPWRDLWPVSPREFAGTAAAAEATANSAKPFTQLLMAAHHTLKRQKTKNVLFISCHEGFCFRM
jgi:hypothetical protein